MNKGKILAIYFKFMKHFTEVPHIECTKKYNFYLNEDGEYFLDGYKLSLNYYEVINFIKGINDPEYTTECIKRRGDLGLELEDIIGWDSTKEFTTKWMIERRHDLGLSSGEVSNLIESINDPEYTKECIERREDLGLSSWEVSDLIKSINDPEYTKECIERREDLGLKFLDVDKLIISTNDLKYKKDCIEKGIYLGTCEGKIVDYYFIINKNNPEFTKECIERRNYLRLEPHEVKRPY